jgi:PPM family protein phosphatase
MNLKGKLEVVGLTDTGRVRSQNEDSIGDDVEIGVIALADGMGGYKGGEVASAIAINTVMEELKQNISKLTPGDSDPATGYANESLAVRDAIIKANDTIYQTAQSQPQYQGMGTTVVMAIFYDNRMTIAHVGDSRMYRFRHDALEQITSDHSLLQELVDRGFYTEDEARQSLNKNLVTRALGIEPTVAVDLREDMTLPGDIYLLCSDGLSDMVEDDDIYLTIKSFGTNLEDTAKQLIDLANQNGGKDNVSVILAKPLKDFPARKHWYDKVVDWFF